MRALILTSSLGMSYKDEDETKHSCAIDNTNHICDVIQLLLPARNKLVYVASDPYAFDITDLYAGICRDSWDMTMPFGEYVTLDGRNYDHAAEILSDADLVILSGGHVPTQNKFFQQINLKQIICNTNALIIGVSAGSMNSADIVYAMPEEVGEAADQHYNRWLSGLGLTTISILPHYSDWADLTLDGYHLVSDIMLPDSYKRPMLAYSDGTYIVQQNNRYTMYGEGYVVRNGEIAAISNDGKITDITQLVTELYAK